MSQLGVVHRTDAKPLVGREREQGRIDALLTAARAGRSGVLVLTGGPGLGKTALCDWAVRRADDIRVFTARAVESEADLAFAGLSELIGTELDRVALPTPQAAALDAAMARGGPGRVDRFAVGAALLSLLAQADAPVLAVVDDAQWLDAASADALRFAARRLRTEGVAMLFAARPGSVFEPERSGLAQLELDGLASDAARDLLGRTFELTPAVADLLATRTGGNPLALLEVPRLLSKSQLAGEEPIADPLPVGTTLERALLQRLDGLEQSGRCALLTAAASGAERVQPVVDALGVLGLGRGALEAAELGGAITVDGERFVFRHPLLRSAVYHGASARDRRAVHAALARVVGGDSGAWHAAEAAVGEQEDVAARLEVVGYDARRRGSAGAAAGALERAAQLSPPGGARTRRLTEAARDAHIAGRVTTARRLLDGALAEAGDGTQRADIQHIRGRILVMQGRLDAAYPLLVEEARRIAGADPDRAATMLAEACLNCLLGADLHRALTAAREACAVAADGGPAARAFSAAMLASGLVLTGDRAEATAVLDSILPVIRVAPPLSEAGQLVSIAAQCYFWLERDDVADELLGGLIATARQAAAPTALLLPLCCRAELDLRAGRWSVAAAQFEEAASLGEEVEESVFAAYALECLARLAALRGEERRCREYAARASSLVEAHQNELGRLCIASALGVLELGLGRPDAALNRLESARRLAARRGLGEPNVVHWRADLVEAHIRRGDLEAARDALAEFQDEAERTGCGWALGTAARCRGLLARDDEAEGCFADSIDQLAAIGNPFETARTQLCHGERLRRAGDRVRARAALRAGLETFEQLGARPWAMRASAELRATGERRAARRDRTERDALTAHELQVAMIVASGASNREAAGALFLSPKTIEYHLASIYRKLGVRSRTELAARAAANGWLDSSAPPP